MVNVVGMPSNDTLSKVPSLFPSRCFLSHHSWLHRSLSTGDNAGVVNDSDQGTIDGTSDALVNISMCSRADVWLCAPMVLISKGVWLPDATTRDSQRSLRISVSAVIRSPTVAGHVPDEGKAGQKGPACISVRLGVL